MKLPLFSVITPTFNSAAKMAPTVLSVLSQESGLYEYLVIDGGSTDGTLDRLRSYGGQIRWVSEPDTGIYDAMNKGIRLATGHFLIFLGAGDLLRANVLLDLSGDLAEQDQPADERPQLVYGDVWWESDRRIHDGAFTPRKLCHGNICQQAILYERSLFARLGPFDLRYPICADHALNIRAFGDPGVRIRRINRIIADYEGIGVSSTKLDRVFRQDWFRLVRQSFGLGFACRHWLLPRQSWWRLLRRLRRALKSGSHPEGVPS